MAETSLVQCFFILKSQKSLFLFKTYIAVGEDDVECCLAFNRKELIESPAAISDDEKLVPLESLVVEVDEEAAAAYIAPA